MGNENIIQFTLIACLAVILAATFSRPIKLALKLCVNSAVGVTVLTLLNAMGLAVGANIFTGAVCALLGLPGIICVVVISCIV